MKNLFKKIVTITCMALTFAVASICGVALYLDKTVTSNAESSLGTFDVDLNLAYNDLRNNGAVVDGSRSLYLAIDGGSAIPKNNTFVSVGNAVRVNGEVVNTEIYKMDGERCALYLYAYAGESYAIDLGCTTVGDTLTIDGDFTNSTYGTFTLNKTSFMFDGFSWVSEETVEFSFGESVRVAPSEDGFYVTMPQTDLPTNAWMSNLNDNQCFVTRNGVHTAFKCALSKVDAGNWHVNFRNGSAGGLDNVLGSKAIEGDVVTLGGWFTDSDGKSFIKIANMQYELRDGVWTNVTPEIAVYQGGDEVKGNVVTVLPNSEVATLSVTSSSGEVDVKFESGAIQDGRFALRLGESISDYRVICTVSQVLGSRTVHFSKEMLLRVGFTDFVMEEGAAVRVNGEDVNGLRFSAEMSAETYNGLKAQGATFGMVIVPRDYITSGYELTASNLFGANAKYSETAQLGATQNVRKMLHLKDLTPKNYDNDSNYEIRGAITDILTSNITREFVGVAYAEVDGMYMLASYYGDDQENNARSIYYVAQKAIDANDHASALQEKYIDAFAEYVADNGKTYNRTYTVNHIITVKGESTVETETFTAPINSPIHLIAREIGGYKVTSASVINSKVYANKDLVFNFYYTEEGSLVTDSMAWYHPPLDNSNNYDNATNDAIAQTMKNAGFTTVLLGGVQNVAWDSAANVEAMRNIIDMFYRNGIKTVVSIGNWKNDPTKYYLDYVPDFSNHEGFVGFFAWDEPLPTNENLNKVAEYAQWYKGVYADKTMPFMVNLNPSYASFFNGNTTECVPEYATYPEYVKAYCDIVLSQLDGTNFEKYLSVDTYPINSDGTMRDSFLYDMAILKAYAVEYGAHMQIALQACGYASEGSSAPTEEQLRLQLYSALAFGADSLSWWAYTTANGIYDAAIDKDGNTTGVYTSIQNVNNELASFGSLYQDYTWKGVIMSSPSKGFFGYGADAQYNAYQKVKDESVFQKYLLSASDTQSFSSISGSGSNYIVSVMEDEDGAEGFVVVNYSAIKDNKTLKLTFKANEQGNYAIYKSGAMETVEIGTSGYTLTLAPGEGAFIAVAKSDHTVTFKNWDGTVLQEETLSFGSVPEYKGITPTKTHYKFVGWTPEIGAIYKDTVYTAMFDEAYTTYNTGDSIGQINLPTAISMSALDGKAIHFEFKFASETGSFGFQVMGLEWNRISDIIIVEKTASGITAKIKDENVTCGRVVEVGDGWYAWELNADAFTGEQATTAPTIDFIYPRQNVSGSLYIDWNSMSVVDAYTSRDVATKYNDGDKLNGGANYVLPTPISMVELSGKALRFEFKFESETGSFAFSLMEYAPWLRLTNTVTIKKTESGFTVTDDGANKPCGRIVDAGDGWYAWEINATDFPGSGAATAQVIDIIVPRNTVVGTLYLDWNSFAIVDEYDNRIEKATKMEAGDASKQLYFKNNASISVTDLAGKAIQVDFQPADNSEGELFRFSLHSSSWNNMTGTVVISRSGNTITANQGIIVDTGDGWYSWQLCHALFMGDGSNKPGATEVAFLYTGTITHAVYIYGEGVKVVDSYDKTAYATQFVQGDELKNVVAKRVINKSDWNNTWSGFALYLEFKFENEADGELFRFAVAANSWANITATIVISKNGDQVTANRGQVIALDDGWYAWTVSADAFEGGGAANATDIAFIMAAGQPIAASKVWILPYLKAVQIS